MRVGGRVGLQRSDQPLQCGEDVTHACWAGFEDIPRSWRAFDPKLQAGDGDALPCLEAAAAQHDVGAVAYFVGVGRSEAELVVAAIEGGGIGNAEVHQQGRAGVAGRGQRIDAAVAGTQAQENLAAGQGVGHESVRCQFHPALGLVARVDDPADTDREGRIAVGGATKQVAAAAVGAVGQVQQACVDRLQLGADGMAALGAHGRVVGLDGQFADPGHRLAYAGEGVFLKAQAVLQQVGVLAVALQFGQGAVQPDGQAGRDRIILGSDHLLARGQLLLGVRQPRLLGQHRVQRLLVQHAGRDASVHRRTALSSDWNKVSAVAMICEAAW